MLDFIKNYAWALYLGLSLGYLGVMITELRYWIIIIPLIILINTSRETAVKKAKLDIFEKL